MSIISKETKIEFEIFPVQDGKYGYLDERGEWTGLIGELIRRVSLEQPETKKKMFTRCSQDANRARYRKL